MNDRDQREQNHTLRRGGRHYMLWLGWIAGVIAVLMIVGAVYESMAEASDARTYPPPGQMVDVGGFRLHINCTGTGSPTVVIDAGLGDWSTMWGFVQPEVAKTTRVCTYDRAGNGWSEAGPASTGCRTLRQGTAYLASERPYSGALCDRGAFGGRPYGACVCTRICIGGCRGCADRIDESPTIHPATCGSAISVVL